MTKRCTLQLSLHVFLLYLRTVHTLSGRDHSATNKESSTIFPEKIVKGKETLINNSTSQGASKPVTERYPKPAHYVEDYYPTSKTIYREKDQPRQTVFNVKEQIARHVFKAPASHYARILPSVRGNNTFNPHFNLSGFLPVVGEYMKQAVSKEKSSLESYNLLLQENRPLSSSTKNYKPYNVFSIKGPTFNQNASLRDKFSAKLRKKKSLHHHSREANVTFQLQPSQHSASTHFSGRSKDTRNRLSEVNMTAAQIRLPRSANTDGNAARTKYKDNFELNIEKFKECAQKKDSDTLTLTMGYIYIVGKVEQHSFCRIFIEGPPQTIFYFSLRMMHPCKFVEVTVWDSAGYQRSQVIRSQAGKWPSWHAKHGQCKTLPIEAYTFSNAATLSITTTFVESQGDISVDVIFSSMTLAEASRRKPELQTIFVTFFSGFVQTPGMSQGKPYAHNMDSCASLIAPYKYVIMTSFLVLDLAVSVGIDGNSCIQRNGHIDDHLVLYHSASCVNRTRTLCSKPAPGPQIHRSGAMSLYFYSDDDLETSGFRMVFSFHAIDDHPQLVNDDQWNCSVPSWPQSGLHFPCNLQWDCLGGEDELTCRYSHDVSNVTCADGMLAVNGRCYFYKIGHWYRYGYTDGLTWLQASHQCISRGLRLASLPSDREMNDIFHVLSYSQAARIYVGLRLAFSTSPSIYQHMWRWIDGTIAYYLGIWNHIRESAEAGSLLGPPSAYEFNGFVPSNGITTGSLTVEFTNVYPGGPVAYLCEDDLDKDSDNLDNRPCVIELRTVEVLTSDRAQLLQCPDNHTTHAFLACDVTSACWARDHTTCHIPEVTTLPPMYLCASQGVRIAYSLVCDFRQDCTDNSDEEFCFFPECKEGEIQCGNKQCIPFIERCDIFTMCLDATDELRCVYFEIYRFMFAPKPVAPPAIVEFTGRGNVTFGSLEHGKNCPPTHFQCPGNGYCLPVYTRCNGPFDCPDREDEFNCDEYTCPGYYRCRNSRVCLHPDHLCDGKYMCPDRDDELLCDAECPVNCTCYGWAWYCRRNPAVFAANHQLRFLAAEGANITASDLRNNVMLVELRLIGCGLENFQFPKLPNLRIMDVSDNAIWFVESFLLRVLPNLISLSLAGNPVTHLFKNDYADIFLNSRTMRVSSKTTDDSTNNTILKQIRKKIKADLNTVISTLKYLDLSRIKLEELEPTVLSVFPHLQVLNVSDMGLRTIRGDGFQHLRSLRVLDLRGNPLSSFSGNVFFGLNSLDSVSADTYKLCCPSVLPETFNLRQCQAPSDEVSSCQALLRSNTYRILLALNATLAIVGNLASLFYRLVINTTVNRQGFGILVTHLCVSDGLMGVFMAIIGVADRLYMGTYLWNDIQWKQSPVCQLAGLLALLSSEVSTFLVCLVTLDRFLAIRFPFRKLRFGSTSGQVVGVVAWVIGLGIAGFPLLPVRSQWKFYGQVGICLPLPITRADFPGQSYAFGVMIVLNSVLFLLLALGNVFIYWSIQHHKMATTDSSQASKDVTIARRLLSVVMSDFVCWFPVCLLGLMAEFHYPVSGEVNVAMAIIVLPFNSALNPFLYTFNILRERRRRAQEKRMMKWLSRQNAAKA